MKRNLVSVLLCLTMSVSSCYDDTALWEAVNAHEERISDLETLCARMNTNISALQKIVEALQNNNCVTGVFPIMQGDEVIGLLLHLKFRIQSQYIMVPAAKTAKMVSTVKTARTAKTDSRLLSV